MTPAAFNADSEQERPEVPLHVTRAVAFHVGDVVARAERSTDPAERARLCEQARALVLAWRAEFEEGIALLRRRNDPRADEWAEGGRRGFESMLCVIDEWSGKRTSLKEERHHG